MINGLCEKIKIPKFYLEGHKSHSNSKLRVSNSIFISGTGGFEIKYNAAKNRRCFSQALRLQYPLAGFRTENRQGAESFLFLELIVASQASICFSIYLLESRHGFEHMHQRVRIQNRTSPIVFRIE